MADKAEDRLPKSVSAGWREVYRDAGVEVGYEDQEDKEFQAAITRLDELLQRGEIAEVED